MKIETAKRIYPQVPAWYKEVLEDEFGKENLIKREFTDIKTLEDAMNATGHTTGYLKKSDPESQDEWAYRMLKMVAKAINQGWTPDWNNTNQAKYYPYFGVLPSGSGFSDSGTSYYYEYTCVGSRLCFESSKKAEYAAKQFEDLYTQFLTITK